MQALERPKVFERPLPHFSSDISAPVCRKLTNATFHIASKLAASAKDGASSGKLTGTEIMRLRKIATGDATVAQFGYFNATAIQMLPLCVKYNLCEAVREMLCGVQAQGDPHFAYQMRAILVPAATSGDVGDVHVSDLTALGACTPVAYAVRERLNDMVLTLVDCSSPMSMMVPVVDEPSSGWQLLEVAQAASRNGTQDSGAVESNPHVRVVLHPSVVRAEPPLQTVLERFLSQVETTIVQGEATAKAIRDSRQPKWAVAPEQKRENAKREDAKREDKPPAKDGGDVATTPAKPKHRIWGSRPPRPKTDDTEVQPETHEEKQDDVADSRLQRLKEQQKKLEDTKRESQRQLKALMNSCTPSTCVTDLFETILGDVDFALKLANNVRVRWSYAQVHSVVAALQPRVVHAAQQRGFCLCTFRPSESSTSH